MPIYIGTSTKNQKNIVTANKEMQKVYCGDKLVWSKAPPFTPIKFGRLYAYESTINIANPGWSIPSFNQVFAAGGLKATLGVNSALKAKENNPAFWTVNDGVNSSGLNIRGGGAREEYSGIFAGLKTYYNCWLLPGSGGYARLLRITEGIAEITGDEYVASYKRGYSVRLIKNDSTDPGIYTDYDGNKYPTVKIGNQVWLARDLIVTHDIFGNEIPTVTSGAAWVADTVKKTCLFNNDPANL